MTTWRDIKFTTLQKMFSISGASTNIPNDSASMEYINAMPQACNEALQLLSTAGKFIIKEFNYVNYPFDNLLGKDTFKTYSIVNETMEFAINGAHSFYFRINGLPLSCKLYVGEHEIIDFYPEENEINPRAYTMFKGNITYPELEEGEDDTVKIIVNANSPVNITNMCFYNCEFMTDADVPQYEKYITIKMNDVVDDFYQLAPAELYDLGTSGNDYIVADKYFQEADKTLVIPREEKGMFKIHYRAYPQQITLSTPDETELALDPEVAALVPIYMASVLYKDDDLSVATIYRNEFEVGRDALTQGALIPRKEKFVPSSGWC